MIYISLLTIVKLKIKLRTNNLSISQALVKRKIEEIAFKTLIEKQLELADYLLPDSEKTIAYKIEIFF